MTIYKRCNLCGVEWTSQDEFLADRELELNGYQVNFTDADAGLFLFTHLLPHCHSTLAVPVGGFTHLYSGQHYSQCKSGGEGCPMHCHDSNNLQSCHNSCSHAWIRQVLGRLSQRHRRA